MQTNIKVDVVISLDREVTEEEAEKIVAEMDYNFNHESIVDTEIIDFV